MSPSCAMSSDQMASSPRCRVWIVLAAALVIRVVAAVGLQHYLDDVVHRPFLIEGDANGYWTLGEGIVAGRDYALYDPPRRVLRMPGFPATLAAGMVAADALGLSDSRPLVVRLLLAVVGTAACAAVYLLGRAVTDESTALLAAALAAVSPALVLFSVQELSETAFGAMLTVSLWCFARMLNAAKHDAAWRTPLGWALATGVALAGANLMRPSWMLATVVFGAIALFAMPSRRRAVVLVAVMAAAMFGTLAPWAARNQRVTGHWIWTTLWVGPSLYDGLHPEATGESDMRFFEEDGLVERMSEYDVDHEYRRRSWAFVRENPGRAAELAVVKCLRYWSPIPNAAQFGRWWIAVPLAGWFALMMLGAAAGVWKLQRQWVVWALCAGPIFYFAAVHSVFVGSLRYRLPAEYPLLVVSATGFLSVRRRIRKNDLP